MVQRYGSEELRPWNVAFYENDGFELEAAIAYLPYRFRALKPEPAGKMVLPSELSLCQVSSCSLEEPMNDTQGVIEYTVKNTFIEVNTGLHVIPVEVRRPHTV